MSQMGKTIKFETEHSLLDIERWKYHKEIMYHMNTCTTMNHVPVKRILKSDK